MLGSQGKEPGRCGERGLRGEPSLRAAPGALRPPCAGGRRCEASAWSSISAVRALRAQTRESSMQELLPVPSGMPSQVLLPLTVPLAGTPGMCALLRPAWGRHPLNHRSHRHGGGLADDDLARICAVRFRTAPAAASGTACCRSAAANPSRRPASSGPFRRYTSPGNWHGAACAQHLRA